MKKWTFVLVIAGMLMSGLSVYAESEETPEWFTDMIEWKTERIEQALEDGDITEDEAEAWLDHLEDRVEYHEEYGFDDFGHCGYNGGYGGYGHHGRRGISGTGFGRYRDFDDE